MIVWMDLCENKLVVNYIYNYKCIYNMTPNAVIETVLLYWEVSENTEIEFLLWLIPYVMQKKIAEIEIDV